MFRGDFGFFDRVDVGGHGHSQIAPDFTQKAGALATPQATVAVDGRAIGLVVARLEDKTSTHRSSDGF